MSHNDPTPAVVRPTPLSHLSIPNIIATVARICAAAADCAEVQSSRATRSALVVLRRALERAQASLARRTAAAKALAAAKRKLKIEYSVALTAARAYEKMVDRIAGGQAAAIREAGLPSTEDEPPTAPTPRKVTRLRGRPGKRAREAMLWWDATRGATRYAMQVKYTPDDPAAPWVPLEVGTRRRYRTLTAPRPGARLLVRVAAVGTDGAPGEWSNPVLVTAC